jgi:hypothetical protein
VKYVYDYNTTSYFEPDGLTRSISSIIGTALDGIFQGWGEIVLNLASPSFLGFNIDPPDPAPAYGTAAYLGQSFIPLDLDGAGGYETLAFYLRGSDLYGGFDPNTGNPTGGPDGRADALSPKFIMKFLEDSGFFNLISAPSYYDSPPPVVPAYYDPHVPPDTYLEIPEIGKGGTAIHLTGEEVAKLKIGYDFVPVRVAGLSPYVRSDRMIYHWRVNEGPYRVAYGNRIVLPPMFDGKYTIEVQAYDPDLYLDPVPAVLTFTLDRNPPAIHLEEMKVENGVFSGVLLVRDSASSEEEISVSYRMDGGRFKPTPPRSQIVEKVTPGHHTLEVRAVDGSGNVAERTFTFIASEGGKGGLSCSVGGEGSPSFLLIPLLLFLFAYLTGRKSRERL